MSRTATWALLALTAAAAQAAFATALVVSAEPVVTVPEIEGLAYGTARARVLALDVDVNVERTRGAASDLDEIGDVLESDPAPGEPIRDGDTVELIVGVRPEPTTVDATAVPFEGLEWADASALTSGECASWQVVDAIGLQLDPIDCERSHTFQLVVRSEPVILGVVDGDAISDAAWDECLSSFEDFVGVPYGDSALYLYWLTPTVEGWNAGDREVVCLVYVPDGKNLVGSAEGSLW